MKRIGLTAGKIAKGNLAIYNLCVILISFIFSFFVFITAGAAVVFALITIGYVGTEIMGLEFEKNWSFVRTVCMVSLTAIVALFNIFAIMANIRFSKKKLLSRGEEGKK